MMRKLTDEENKRLDNLVDEVLDIMNNSPYEVAAALAGIWTHLTYEVEDIGHERFIENRRKRLWKEES